MGREETMNGSSLLHSLEKWNQRLRIGYRLVWVQCWGISLPAWDMAQIQKIVAAIGEMEVDDDVEKARRLDRAWVLIKTPWRPTIQHTVNVSINGEDYRVYIA